MESGKLTRRELLQRLSALAGGLILTGPISGCEGFWQREPAIPVDSWHKGVCRFCGTGCGIMIGVRDGKVVDVKGDEYAHNRGRICIKGILNREILYVRDRALYPMIRRNGRLERASWDEAMSLVAERFREAIDRYGPDSVAFYGSGQLFTEESYTANKLFKAGIGTNNVDGNPRLCMASAAAGYISVFGKDEPMGCYEDIDHATCFFITGSNTADCHPIVWERIMDRKRSRPETVIIVVDPRRTRTARHADYHLAIRPGTDVALYNAMIYEFIRNGFIDQDMVENYLTFREGDAERTFEDLKRHVAQYTPERVAPVCGVDARQIEEVAYLFAASEATMSIWTMGLNQQAQGTAANRLINAMHLLTGHIGRPGATPFSLTGQPNAGGGVRDTGALAHALPNGRVVTNPQHRAEMEDLWGVPRGRISPKPGYHAVAMFEAMARGDLKCVLIMGTNPAQSLPHAERYREAMQRTFLVVADAIYPTETAQFADVFLPSAMWVEKGGVFSQSERRYHLVPKLVDPPGEARSDLEISRRAGRSTGLRRFDQGTHAGGGMGRVAADFGAFALQLRGHHLRAAEKRAGDSLAGAYRRPSGHLPALRAGRGSHGKRHRPLRLLRAARRAGGRLPGASAAVQRSALGRIPAHAGDRARLRALAHTDDHRQTRGAGRHHHRLSGSASPRCPSLRHP